MPSPVFTGAYYNEVLSNRIPAALVREVQVANAEGFRKPGIYQMVTHSIVTRMLLVRPRLETQVVVDKLKVQSALVNPVIKK